MTDAGANIRQTTTDAVVGGGSDRRVTVDYLVCDVFTDRPLEGNQLGVFVDARGMTAGRMQALARELNFSESTFVLPSEQGGEARVRIFTPTRELPFAGHPALGTAFVLADRLGLDSVGLETGNGLVRVGFQRRDSASGFGWMRQPIPTIAPYGRSAELLAALAVERSELPIELYDNGVPHVFVALGTEAEVVGLRPDFAGLGGLGPVGVNCFAGSGAHWKTRMFGPGVGVEEDPATGSAAGPLAMHLARHGLIGWGQEIEILQGAEIGRPSRLFARVEGGPEGAERVEVGGSVVIVARGTFTLPA